MILNWHYLVCLFYIIRLAISFCESVSSYFYAQSVGRLLLQLIHLILLQVILLIRGALKGAPSGGRRAEGGGRRAEGGRGRAMADGDKFLLLFSNTRNFV